MEWRWKGSLELIQGVGQFHFGEVRDRLQTAKPRAIGTLEALIATRDKSSAYPINALLCGHEAAVPFLDRPTIINTQEEFPWHVNHVELSLDMTQTESR